MAYGVMDQKTKAPIKSWYKKLAHVNRLVVELYKEIKEYENNQGKEQDDRS